MKAVIVRQKEGKPFLEWGDVEDVTYGADEVLLEIKASAVNRADLSQARGNYPPPAGVTEILGLEASGVVSAVGSQVMDWQPGDRVCCLYPGADMRSAWQFRQACSCDCRTIGASSRAQQFPRCG